MTGIGVRWTWLFIDVPARDVDRAVDFWTAVTGTTASGWRGDDDEFTTLVPPDGDPWLKAQRVQSGDVGVHVDLDVDDPAAATELATDLGATVVAERGYVVMASPGGFVFCLTHATDSSRSQVRRGAPSLADQLCIDIPANQYEQEAAFWAALTGWTRRPSSGREEFDWLQRPDGLPVRLLLQRLDEPDGPVRGHLDIACRDRTTEVDRHAALGAAIVVELPWWTVMRDPTGRDYCLTDRDPETGRLET